MGGKPTPLILRGIRRGEFVNGKRERTLHLLPEGRRKREYRTKTKQENQDVQPLKRRAVVRMKSAISIPEGRDPRRSRGEKRPQDKNSFRKKAPPPPTCLKKKSDRKSLEEKRKKFLPRSSREEKRGGALRAGSRSWGGVYRKGRLLTPTF